MEKEPTCEMDATRQSMVFPVGEFIADEMKVRCWSRNELVARMSRSFEDAVGLQLELALLLDTPIKGVILDERTAMALGRAFGTSASLWMKLDRQWQNYTCPRNVDSTTAST